jgi:hypothetical protein
MGRDYLLGGKMLIRCLLRMAIIGALVIVVDSSQRYDVLVYGANAAGVRRRRSAKI